MDALRQAQIVFAFATMVSHSNLHCVTSRRWFDDIWDAGARFGFLIDYVPVDAHADGSLVLTDEDRAYKTAAVGERFEEARPLVMNFPPDEYGSGACQAAGRGMIHINADGYVEPCPFSHYAADNVLDKPIGEILASPFFTELRSGLLDCPNPTGQCLLFDHESEVRQIASRTGAFATEGL